MLDHTGTDDAVTVARGEALRDANYASLTRTAATDNSNALIDEVLRVIGTVEARERQRNESQGGAQAGSRRLRRRSAGCARKSTAQR
jgi:hypothetical protein